MLGKKRSTWPRFSAEECNAVQRVLKAGDVNYWTGAEGRTFEREFADWVGVKYAIALMNGTVALELALRGCEIGVGDEVIVTPRSFFASVSCVVNVGATPVFADVNVNSGNLTAENISHRITSRTKAIICVHLGGHPCDMDPIMQLADRLNIRVIEDCAQAHGARYKGRSLGSIGHIGAWSFCQDKIMTTGGEGGMLTCDDEKLWRAMWAYKDHGKSYEAVYERHHPEGYRWLHESFGSNFRMTEMQAAIGRVQLSRMPEWTSVRTKYAMEIRRALLTYSGDDGFVRLVDLKCSGFDSCSFSSCNCQHAYYRYYFYICPENLPPRWSRDRIIDQVNELGVPCFSGSCSEIYLEKAFEGTDYKPDHRLPNAQLLGENAISLLVHPTLTPEEMNKIVEALHCVFGKILNAG